MSDTLIIQPSPDVVTVPNDQVSIITVGIQGPGGPPGATGPTGPTGPNTITTSTTAGSTGFVTGSGGVVAFIADPLPIGHGGTGSATAVAAINALLPSQTSNSGKYLTTDGSAASWGTVVGLAIGNAIGSGTANSVLYVDASGHLGQDSINLTWNDSTCKFTIATNNSASGAIQFQVKDNSNNSLFSVNDRGMATALSITSNSGVNTVGLVVSSDATITAGSQFTTPLTVKAAPSQSANLTTWKDSSGTAKAVIDAAGNMSLGNATTTVFGGYTTLTLDGSTSGEIEIKTNGTAKAYLYADGTGAVWSAVSGQDSSFYAGGVDRFHILSSGLVGVNKSSSMSGQLHIVTSGNSVKGLIVQGSSSQSANLQEWQNSSGTVLACVDSGGNICVGNGQGDGGTGAKLSVSTGIYTPGFVWATGGLRISAGNTITSNPLAGILLTGGSLQVISGGAYLTYNSSLGFNILNADGSTLGLLNCGYITTNVYNAGAVGHVIKGAVSQSANLQEWQNSSGTVLTKVNNVGKVFSLDSSGSKSISIYHDGTNGNVESSSGNLNFGSVFVATDGISFGLFNSSSIFKMSGSARIIWGSGTWTTASDVGLTRNNAGILEVNTGVAGTFASLIVGQPTTGTVGLTVQAIASATANLQEWQNSSGTALTAIDKAGGIKPAHMADSAAANDTIYYSTTANKLVYRDSGGIVNNLY